MFGLGVGEILIILAFALIFIGPKKLPELAKSLGKGLREFQRAKDEILHTMNSEQHQTAQTFDQDFDKDDHIEAEVTGVSESDPEQDSDHEPDSQPENNAESKKA
jgi:TatA/E family protein of Tat protein translocase